MKIITYGPFNGDHIEPDLAHTREAKMWTGTVNGKEVSLPSERDGFVGIEMTQEEAEAFAERICRYEEGIKGGTWDWEITDE